MKKLFLAITVIGLVTVSSCKKEETKVEDATENATEEGAAAAEETAETVASSTATASDIPQFSSPEIQKFAEEYAAYYNDMMAASKSGDAAKIQELSAKSTEWAKKASDFTQKMTAEDAQKWVEWAQKIASAAQGQ